MPGIDPIAIARFMVLPGAGELLEAFARIPEGPVRNSLIHHAEMLASAYNEGVANTPPPDPLRVYATTVAPELPALGHVPSAAFEEGTVPHPPPRSVEEEVIQRRLAGEWPVDIHRALHVPKELVVEILAKARRLGGIEFPPLAAGERLEQEPAPAKPHKPKVWPTPYKRQDHHSQKLTRFMAKNAGLTIEEQQAREADIIRRFMEGQYPVQIQAELGIEGHIVATIRKRALGAGVRLPKLAKGGAARKAMGKSSDPRVLQQLKREREAREAAAKEPVQAAVGMVERDVVFPPPYDTLVPQAQSAVREAAAGAGLSVEQWQERQRRIVNMRKEGYTPSYICEQLGLTKWQVVKLVQRARGAGVVFPILTPEEREEGEPVEAA